MKELPATGTEVIVKWMTDGCWKTEGKIIDKFCQGFCRLSQAE